MLGMLQGILEGLVGNKEKDLPRLYRLLHRNEDFRLTRFQQALCRVGDGQWNVFLLLVLLACLACVVTSVFGKMMGFSFWGLCGLGSGVYALGIVAGFKQGLFQRDWHAPSLKLKQHFYELMGDFLVKNPKLVSSFAPNVALLEEGKLSTKWLCETRVVMKKLGLYRGLGFDEPRPSETMVSIVKEQAKEWVEGGHVSQHDTWKI